jgi:hypothetical protein
MGVFCEIRRQYFVKKPQEVRMEKEKTNHILATAG